MTEFYLKTQVPHDCPEEVKQVIIDEMVASLPDGAVFVGSIGLGMLGVGTVAIIYTTGETTMNNLPTNAIEECIRSANLAIDEAADKYCASAKTQLKALVSRIAELEAVHNFDAITGQAIIAENKMLKDEKAYWRLTWNEGGRP